MSTELKSKKKEQKPQEPENKELQVLQQQQENDNSEDEEFLSDSAEVVDANDATRIAESLNLDFKNSDQKVWLVRIPRFLAQRWRNKEALHGQELGRIRIKKNTSFNEGGARLRLGNEPQYADIPHEYDLQLTRGQVENQYVFTEQNLQKFDQANDPKVEFDIPDKAQAVSAEEKDRQRRAQWAANRRRQFNKYKNTDGSDKVLPFVKTIPKKTAIVGTIVHEAQIIPSMHDPNYTRIIMERKKQVKEEPRPSVTLLQEHSGVTLSNAGLTLRNANSSFLKTSTDKKVKTDGRAIRMPQKDLFDILFKLFDQFDYWSLKGLKERTKQPEVYLKETLEQIAVLIKKGPYALKYALKKEYKELKDQERSARLGDLARDDEDDEEEDNEEDVEMEDVM